MFEAYEPKYALAYFKELTEIPHGSGNEKAVSDYVKNFADKLGLATIQDELFNLIVVKDAAPGYEKAPRVIFQAHLDMVCEKNQDTSFDFSKDALDLYVDGDYIKARGTTLGADNGIAVALFMALMNNCNRHPAMEFIFTTQEETGMAGAMNLDTSKLLGRRMVNLDADSDTGFIMGCAAGTIIKYELPIKRAKLPEPSTAVKISVGGLVGGHSGMDINKNRAHAIKLLGNLLSILDEKFYLCISDIGGGMKVNAIPREAYAVVAIKNEDLDAFKVFVEDYNTLLSKEFRNTDPELALNFEILDGLDNVLDDESKAKLLSSLLLFPNGVLQTSSELESLVNSSCNLGVLETKSDNIVFLAMPRGAAKFYNERTEKAALGLSKLTNAKTEFIERSPAWPYNAQSEFLESAKKVYEKVYGSKPKISAVHAGLECGLFAEKIPGLDIISFGAVIHDLHTPDERVSISSVGRVWRFLCLLLESTE